MELIFPHKDLVGYLFDTLASVQDIVNLSLAHPRLYTLSNNIVELRAVRWYWSMYGTVDGWSIVYHLAKCNVYFRPVFLRYLLPKQYYPCRDLVMDPFIERGGMNSIYEIVEGMASVDGWKLTARYRRDAKLMNMLHHPFDDIDSIEYFLECVRQGQQEIWATYDWRPFLDSEHYLINIVQSLLCHKDNVAALDAFFGSLHVNDVELLRAEVKFDIGMDYDMFAHFCKVHLREYYANALIHGYGVDIMCSRVRSFIVNELQPHPTRSFLRPMCINLLRFLDNPYMRVPIGVCGVFTRKLTRWLKDNKKFQRQFEAGLENRHKKRRKN